MKNGKKPSRIQKWRHQTKGHREPKIRGFFSLDLQFVALQCTTRRDVAQLLSVSSNHSYGWHRGTNPGWCRRKAQGGGCVLHCDGGVETNQTYVCQNNQFAFILQVFVSWNQKMVFEIALISPLCCLSRFVFGRGKSSSLSLVDTAGTTSYLNCSSHQPVKVKCHKCEIHAFIINDFKQYLFEK